LSKQFGILEFGAQNLVALKSYNVCVCVCVFVCVRVYDVRSASVIVTDEILVSVKLEF
jgi:hypothetical protein